MSNSGVNSIRLMLAFYLFTHEIPRCNVYCSPFFEFGDNDIGSDLETSIKTDTFLCLSDKLYQRIS